MTPLTIYETCPVYETPSFRLPGEYQEHRYVRFAILPKASPSAVGTVEIFGGESGVLRIDIAAGYDKAEYIEELLRLAVLRFIRDFQIKSLKVKAANTPERIPLLEKYGFVPSAAFRPGLGYYERPITKTFDAGKGIAFCGLACCVCSENQTCAGCKNDACRDSLSCKNYRYCSEKGLNGCWECDSFPCDAPMLTTPRVRAFARYAAENGLNALLRALKNNQEHGVLYHYKGKLSGDYDLFQSEDEIMAFLISQ